MMSQGKYDQSALVQDDILESNELDENKILENARLSVTKLFPLMDSHEKEKTVLSVVNKISGYGLIEEYLNDDSVNEIMINTNSSGYIEKNGVKHPISFHTTDNELIRIAQKVANKVGSRFDRSSPIVDAWLSDGSRFHCVMPPISPDGVCITIRKFLKTKNSLSDFCSSDEMRDYIVRAVASKRSMIIAGGTSTGKTTLLDALISSVSSNDRIVSIEETAELVVEHNHHVRLVARPQNSEGLGQVTLSQLVKASLRMRPDRIVLGEVRSNEAFDLLQALNTGHAGSMCTVHANGPEEVMFRLASLAMFAHAGMDFESLLKQAQFGIDLIICVDRNECGSRYISSIHKSVFDNGKFRVLPVDVEKDM